MTVRTLLILFAASLPGPGPALAADRLAGGVGSYTQQWIGYADRDHDSLGAYVRAALVSDRGLICTVDVQLEAKRDGNGTADKLGVVYSSPRVPGVRVGVSYGADPGSERWVTDEPDDNSAVFSDGAGSWDPKQLGSWPEYGVTEGVSLAIAGATEGLCTGVMDRCD